MGATITNNSGGTGTVNLVRGGDNKNSPLYLSGDNTYTGTTVLSIRNDLAASTVNGTNSVTYLLTERQLGAMPTARQRCLQRRNAQQRRYQFRGTHQSLLGPGTRHHAGWRHCVRLQR